jgi:hypothetical protein
MFIISNWYLRLWSISAPDFERVLSTRNILLHGALKQEYRHSYGYRPASIRSFFVHSLLSKGKLVPFLCMKFIIQPCCLLPMIWTSSSSSVDISNLYGSSSDRPSIYFSLRRAADQFLPIYSLFLTGVLFRSLLLPSWSRLFCCHFTFSFTLNPSQGSYSFSFSKFVHINSFCCALIYCIFHWTDLAQDKDQWRALVNMTKNHRIP